MSKFCENCGAEMDDNETVCKNCGPQAEVKPEEPKKDSTAKVEEKVNEVKSAVQNMDTKKAAIYGGIAVAVIVVLIIIFSIFGKGYETPIKNYFKGMEKAKASTYVKAYPEFMDMGDKYDDDDMEKMLDSLEDEYGEKIKISYKITKKDKIKKDDLKNVQKYIKQKYDEEVKVSKGYELKVKATIKGKDDDDTDTQKMYVYKINGKWSYLSISPKTAKDSLKD